MMTPQARNTVSQIIGSALLQHYYFAKKKRVHMHCSEMNASRDSADFLMLTHHLIFHNINIQKSEKQHCKIVMKLTELLLPLFFNKKRNTWSMAIAQMRYLALTKLR